MKKLLPILFIGLFFFSFPNPLLAQQTTFRINYDIANFDIPGGIVENPSGNIVFAGTNTTFLPVYGNIVEVDPVGNVQWAKAYTGSISTEISDIKNVAGGGYVAAGSSDPGLMILRLDNNGNISWANRYEVAGAGGEYANKVLPTSDGGFVAAGYVYDADPDGAGGSPAQDSTNMFCVKVDASGNLQWGRVFFVTTAYINDHSLSDIAEVSDGYIFVGSSSESGSSESRDAIVLKTNFSGALQWSYKFGSGGNTQNAASIKALSSTQVLIAGENSNEPYYLRMSSSGSVQAGSTYSFGLFGTANGFGTEIFETYDGHYAIIGNYLNPLNLPFDLGAFLMKINPSSGSVDFSKYYVSGLTSILPRGLQVSDSAYTMIFLAQQFTGFNYQLLKADENGLMNNSDCPEEDITVSRSGFNPSLSSFSPIITSNISRNGFSPVVTTLSPDTSIDCRTIVCNEPPVPAASADNNNFCPGGSVTISASGSGSGITYNIYTQPSGGSVVGTAPETFTPSSTTTYYVAAEKNNEPGCESNRDAVTVTVLDPPPSTPGNISGETTPCPGDNETYSISAVSGASSYNWSLNGGGTLTGTGTSVNINWSTPGTWTISVDAQNSCGTSGAQTLQVTVGDPPPAQPGAISGVVDPCPGTQTYSIGTVSGAGSYQWTVSGGGSINSGQGTTSVIIDWTASGGPYTVSVAAQNSCGHSAAQSIQVNVKDAAPDNIGSINGDTPVCFGNENYAVSSVPRATNYDWSLNGGGTITSGQGSNSININWTSAGTHTISVFAENDCGTTGTQTLQVTVDDPPPTQPGSITGTIDPCPGIENYSINSVNGATTYNWTVSNGGTITNGQGGTAVDIDWTTPGGPYTLSVTAENSCGTSAAQTLQINVSDPAPTSIDTIDGDNLVCPGTASYSVPTVSGVTNYDWNLSGGGTITNGQGTNNITINWTTAGNYTLSVTAENACGNITSTPKNIEVLQGVPTTPSINGPLGVCPGIESYTVSSGTGASAYSWSLSGGGNIISGQGTDSIAIDWGSNGGTFQVSVTANNICGNSNVSNISVDVISGPPNGTPVINGDNPACPGSATYTASGVSGASTYNWSLDAGGSITNGQGSDSIGINWNNPGGPFTIEVYTENSCGTGDTNTLTVFVDSIPEFDGDTIARPINPCPGSENYSIGSVANANNYNWTLSGGGNITSGQGSNSISVDWTNSGGPYTLSVSPENDCGNGAAVTQTITVQPGAPSAPPNITGEVTICEGSGTEPYVVDTVAGATTYVWTMLNGGGTIVSGQGTDSIVIDWTGSPGNYQFSVRAENNCGFSADNFHSVNIIEGPPDQPLSINGPIEVCPGSENYEIASVADADNYTWTLSNGGTISSGQGSNNISVNWTNSGGPYQLEVIAENSCGNSPAQTIQVDVLPSPTTPSVDASDQTICEGETTTITASGSTGGNITYNIYDDQSGGSLIGTAPQDVSPDVTSTYYVEAINDAGCRAAGSRIPVEITVLQAPEAPSLEAENQSVCSGDSTVFTANTSGNAEISWWNAPEDGDLLGTGNTFSTGSVSESTTYYVSVTSADGCETLSDRTAATVSVTDRPYLSISTDASNNTIFINEALIATAEPDYYDQYDFFLNDEEVQSDSINTWASSILEDQDVISVIATDGGCLGEAAEITISVNDFPNAFTPNGDGRNDVFLEGFDLVILNRWGQELYKGNEGWDGTFNGKRVAPGTYFYIVKVEDITDSENILKGSVLVNN